jgi:hypothetical protein
MTADVITQAQDSPTAWFAVLERARRTGDTDLQRLAESHLHRLGVCVEFTRPIADRQEATR